MALRPSCTPPVNGQSIPRPQWRRVPMLPRPRRAVRRYGTYCMLTVIGSGAYPGQWRTPIESEAGGLRRWRDEIGGIA